MKKMIAIIASLFGIGASGTNYEAGQIWEYNARDHEKGSRLYIVQVDENKTIGKIYHIYIDGLKIKNPHIQGGIQSVLPHAPVDAKTLKLSLIKKIGTTKDLPDISEGYSVWKKAFDSGEGGVFNISVDKIIEYIEEVVGKSA